MNTSAKIDFPVSIIRRFLEPGPIVMVSFAWKGRTNITTMGWHMLMKFQPSLVGCVISSTNHSFRCAGGRAGPHKGHSVNEKPETPPMVLIVYPPTAGVLRAFSGFYAGLSPAAWAHFDVSHYR